MPVFEEFDQAVATFKASVNAHAESITGETARVLDEIRDKLDELSTFVATQQETLNTQATEALAKFSEMVAYANVLETEAARLRREATAFAKTIDPPPNAPGEMQVEFAAQAEPG